MTNATKSSSATIGICSRTEKEGESSRRHNAVKRLAYKKRELSLKVLRILSGCVHK